MMLLKRSLCKYLTPSLFILFIFSCHSWVFAQEKELSYYLPDISYNPNVLSPEEFLGFQIGEAHVSHDQLYYYMRSLVVNSDRVTMTQYAESHEGRPLIYLTITHRNNQKRITQIKRNHLKLSDPQRSRNVNIATEPLVIYQGYSIHGNEASGANAAMLVAYYLAAGESATVDDLLTKSVILLDPCFNPDGLQRFSTWVNSHKSKNLNPDENDREFSEAWPKGRTNHYWFDLNRDWLLLVHPESRGRVKSFHSWKPNILTDHHEMGKNSTFFFQPGVPSRTNPNTPQLNQKITEDISKYHEAALDRIGSKYFSKKRFDDFYYGKGSTYPDINGSIGILFEQASARGHLQESSNGLLSFPFAIRNHVVTSLSTQVAAIKMKSEILEYQRQFYISSFNEADHNKVKGYIFTDTDLFKVNTFLQLLRQHQIEVCTLSQDITLGGELYKQEQSYLVPLRQKEYRLAKTIFEKVDQFNDSIFYDVSAWTMPQAFNMRYASLDSSEIIQLDYKITGKTYRGIFANRPKTEHIDWNNPSHPKKLYDLLNDSVQTMISLDSSLIKLNGTTGIRKPKIAMLVGNGVTPQSAGEIWHFLDVRCALPITKIKKRAFIKSNLLDKYNTLILVNGDYSDLDEEVALDISSWIDNGGHLICIQKATTWLEDKEWMGITFKKRVSSSDPTKEISTSTSRGANVIGGAIMKSQLALNNALTFGYNKSDYYSFKKGTHFIETPDDPSIKVLQVYDESPLESGYVSRPNIKLISKSPGILYKKKGKGQITVFTDSPVFRGYWYGGYKLLLNAIFFSELAD